MSREVGPDGAVKFHLKAFHVASVRVICASKPSKECSFKVWHMYVVRFDQNVLVRTEAVQNRTFESPESKWRGHCNPEGDLDTVVEHGIFEVGFNVVGRPIGDEVSGTKNIVAVAGLNGNRGLLTFACR